MAKPQKQKVKLQDSDWTSLFPSKSYTIGATKVDISPLSIQELAGVLEKLTLIADKIQESSSLTADAVAKDSMNVINLVSIIMQESPDILSDISGIDVGDVQSLPLDKALDLFNFCLDVNIESQDSLIKNFNGLGDRLSKFMGTSQASSQTRIPLEGLSNS